MILNSLQTFLYFMVSLLISGAEYGYATEKFKVCASN